MKDLSRFLLISGCLLLFHQVAGQDFNIHNPITLPEKSQQAIVTQRIGYTDISIDYHSPGAKGRTIWGELVPYKKVWRAGANENTIITFTDDVQVEGQQLAAGSYGLHLIPGPGQWTFIFSDNHTSWGSYFYEETEDAIRVSVPVQDNDSFREWLSFDFIERERASTTIKLSWGDKGAVFKVTLDIDAIALDNIRKQLRSDAYWEWFSWCQAADYCAAYRINTEEALQWIEKSIQLEENFSNWDVKAKLLTQSGDKKGARLAIGRAIEVGSPVYIERYGRRFLKDEDFERADYLFEQALKKDGAYWRAHLNKGKALMGLGKNKAALKSFKEALKNAPANRKKAIQTSIGQLN
jgi:tetratricopeptide (TPR) repeat protein